MSAAVEASGIAKRYGSLVALEDLTFAANAGEILDRLVIGGFG